MRRHAAFVLVAVFGCGPPVTRPEPTLPPQVPSASPPPAPIAEPEPEPEPEPNNDALPTYVPPPDRPYYRPPSAPAPQAQIGPTPEDEKECKARGGKIQAVCMMGALECIVRHRDAGKRCTDKRDCIGHCLYEGREPPPANATGVCQRTNDPCGCHARVVGGKVQPTICTD